MIMIKSSNYQAGLKTINVYINLTTRTKNTWNKTDRIKGRYRQFKNNSQYPAFNNRQNKWADDQQGYRRLEQHYKPTRFF